ncbi:hypothetical protein C0995_006725 [Termitomyces sp. Mi166|nr:hypothetical protein C0995_006725 [Termitomyces sp. Mi166\
MSNSQQRNLHHLNPFVAEGDNSGLEQRPAVKSAKRRKRTVLRPRAPSSTVNESNRKNRISAAVAQTTDPTRASVTDVDNRSIIQPPEVAHHLSGRETREFIESSLTRSILSGWNTQIAEAASGFTKSKMEMTSNIISTSSDTEPLPLSDEKVTQTSNSAIDGLSLSSQMDEGIIAVEDSPSSIADHSALGRVSQPQPLPNIYVKTHTSPSLSLLLTKGKQSPYHPNYLTHPSI